MNLSAYDITEEPIYKTSYILVPFKKLYIYNVPPKPYYWFLHKYNPKTGLKDFYIALSDNKIETSVCYSTKERGKLVTIDLKPIWFETPLCLESKAKIKVNIILEEEQTDCTIYKLDI